MSNVRFASRLSALVIALFFSGFAQAQTTAPVYTGGGAPGPGKITKSSDRPQGVSGPVPTGLTFGRRLLISNGGADAGLFPHPFTGTQDRGYGQFYSLLGANKTYQLVTAPADADLVLELQLTAPSGSLGGDKKRGTEDALPTFKLTIYDRPSHYILWTISQTIDQANLQKTHDKNFDDALALLATQFVTAAGSSK